MPAVVYLTPEQSAFIERIKAFMAPIYANEGLRYQPQVAEAARQMLTRAAELGLPTAAFFELQLVVAAYDREAALPAHLRDTRFSEP